ncbi:MAG: diguanylate cyclase [Lachnospiraceae bacterium]|nr:diguanylate cyclase [Lachnospiraceae bacterium]
MRDTSQDVLKAENYPEQCQSLVEDFNARLFKYDKDAETLDIIYDVLGARFWSMNFDARGKLIDCHWSVVEHEGEGSEEDVDFKENYEDFINVVHEDDRDYVEKCFHDNLMDRERDKVYDIEFRCIAKNGSVRWFRSVGKVRRRKDGSPITFVGLITDITAKKERELQLQEQYEIVDALSRDYLNVFLVDIPRRKASILKLDGYVTEGFGDKTVEDYPYDPFCAKYIKDRVYSKDQAEITEAMKLEKVQEMLENSDEYVYSYRAIDKGEVHFYQFTYMRIRSKTGMTKVIAGFKNIDDVVRSAKEREALKILSETDIMTNIYNRGYGEKCSTASMTRGEIGMFCILDMDRFKNINDTFGHSIGDKVLIKAAECLKKAFRTSDIVFRLGGDEFAVTAPGVKTSEVGRKLLDRFFEMLDEINIPEMNGYKVSVSVGAIIYGIGRPKSFEEIYKDADTCVYLSKKTQGNSVNFYGE